MFLLIVALFAMVMVMAVAGLAFVSASTLVQLLAIGVGGLWFYRRVRGSTDGLTEDRRTEEAVPERFHGIQGFAPFEAFHLVAQAKAHLERLEKCRARLRNLPPGIALEQVIVKLQALIEEVDERPALLPRFVHFLDVYVEGVVGIAERYVKLGTQEPGPTVKARFLARMEQVVDLCERQLSVTASDRESDLEVEMEVLERRMAADAMLPLGDIPERVAVQVA